MIEFRLPSLGSDMDSGKLLEWKVKPGDKVARGQVVAVVDTSKAAIDIECWDEGVIHQLVTRPDETVAVGTVMALLLAPGETAPEGAAAIAPPPAPAVTAAPVAAAPAAAAPVAAGMPAATAAGERIKISPAARKRAAELGVDIARLPAGTGPHGALTVQDVERSAAAPVDRAAEMRRTIGAAMSRAKREIPHYYLTEAIPLGAATDWLAQENAKRPMASRLLMAVLQLKAVALTLHDYPELNGFFRDGRHEPSPSVHVGVAIALRQGGLIAPALHDVAAQSLDALMTALNGLIRRTRAGSLRSSELGEATITVTNLGEQGVESLLPVIHPPQVAIVGFGRIAPRPWVDASGGLVVTPLVHATLAADHRVSDGHRGARFLAALAERLQHPETL